MSLFVAAERLAEVDCGLTAGESFDIVMQVAAVTSSLLAQEGMSSYAQTEVRKALPITEIVPALLPFA